MPTSFFRLARLTVGALLSFCLVLVSQAQPAGSAPIYRNLVMEGGGIRGIAYGGALQVLQERGVLDSIRRVGGTSAGAIQAALLAVGYSPQEIVEVLQRTPVQRLNDGRLIFLGGGTRLLRQYGWYRGNQLTKYLTELVEAKTGSPDLTLAELHALAQQQPARYRDLYTTGTNLTRQRAEVFSYETHPTMRVADAVRVSMSIPLYFRAVLLDSLNHVVRGKPAPGQPVQVLIDGGLLANYPVDMFDYPRYLAAGSPASGPDARGRTFNPATLGLRLDRDEQIQLDSAPNGRQQLAPYEISDFRSYIGALYTVMLENLNSAQPADWQRTVSISTRGFSPKIKRLSEAQKALLMASGQAGAQQFFARTQVRK